MRSFMVGMNNGKEFGNQTVFRKGKKDTSLTYKK